MAAVGFIQALVSEIVLTSAEDEMKIDVRGDLAGIPAVSLKMKTPATGAGVSRVEVVAGAGFEPATVSKETACEH
jgi:uncharacterized protein (DUF2236 family)